MATFPHFFSVFTRSLLWLSGAFNDLLLLSLCSINLCMYFMYIVRTKIDRLMSFCIVIIRKIVYDNRWMLNCIDLGTKQFQLSFLRNENGIQNKLSATNHNPRNSIFHSQVRLYKLNIIFILPFPVETFLFFGGHTVWMNEEAKKKKKYTNRISLLLCLRSNHLIGIRWFYFAVFFFLFFHVGFSSMTSTFLFQIAFSKNLQMQEKKKNFLYRTLHTLCLALLWR